MRLGAGQAEIEVMGGDWEGVLASNLARVVGVSNSPCKCNSEGKRHVWSHCWSPGWLSACSRKNCSKTSPGTKSQQTETMILGPSLSQLWAFEHIGFLSHILLSGTCGFDQQRTHSLGCWSRLNQATVVKLVAMQVLNKWTDGDL